MGKRQISNEDPNHAIPKQFLSRVRQIVGVEHSETTVNSFHQSKHCAFRLNKLLTEEVERIDSISQQLHLPLQRIPWFESSFWIAKEFRDELIESRLFNESLIYVQNPSSYLPCLILAPQPGDTVLDLAAAPGGKTILMAELMGNEGKISAVEPVRNRFFKLQTNLKRYGAKIVKTYLTDGRSVGRKVPERFDKVLLDAPCSGEARIHLSDPESWKFWSPRKIKEQARKQFGLIRSGFDALKPGGDLIYCTCSFSPEENEAIVSDFLEQTPNSRLMPISLPLDQTQTGLTTWNHKSFHSDLVNAVRVLPDQLMDGFFLAKIKKIDS